MKEKPTDDSGGPAVVPGNVKTSTTTGQVNIKDTCDGHLTPNNTNGAGRPRLGSDSDDSLKWEEFFGKNSKILLISLVVRSLTFPLLACCYPDNNTTNPIC